MNEGLLASLIPLRAARVVAWLEPLCCADHLARLSVFDGASAKDEGAHTRKSARQSVKLTLANSQGKCVQNPHVAARGRSTWPHVAAARALHAHQPNAQRKRCSPTHAMALTIDTEERSNWKTWQAQCCMLSG